MNLKPLDSFDAPQRESQAAGMAKEIGHLPREDRESTQQIEELRAKAKALGKRLGVPEEVVQSLLTVLGQRHVGSDDLRDKLDEIAEHYVMMETLFKGLNSDDPIIGQMIDQAKSAIAVGNFDKAEEILTYA